MKALAASLRSRRFVLWVARLALLAYVLQLSAIDHWHRNPADVIGVEGSSRHVMHCHGALSSCSDVSGLTGSLAEVNLAPLPPAPTRGELPMAVAPLSGAVPPAPDRPPKAA